VPRLILYLPVFCTFSIRYLYMVNIIEYNTFLRMTDPKLNQLKHHTSFYHLINLLPTKTYKEHTFTARPGPRNVVKKKPENHPKLLKSPFWT
jgi:hypothetical protein